MPKLFLLLCMVIAVGGLANFYSYFKTGANNIDLALKIQKEALIHDPIYTWNNDKNEGVELDEYTRQKIQDAYTAAWYILNRSNAEQKNLGLEDKFSKKMVNKITKHYEPGSSFLHNRVDLEHHINLHLFSYDRQIVSFSDQDIKLASVFKNHSSSASELMLDTLNFDIVMGLEDGYWKVFEMLQLDENPKTKKSKQVDQKINFTQNYKGINYYPAENPWLDFWPNYNEQTTRQDLQLIKSLGFNHVRIFLPYSIFGKGSLNKEMSSHLDHFLENCHKNGITVTLTLFDFPESYDLAYYAATRKHLIQVLNKYKAHPAVTIWDLKNEADLDFPHYGKEVVMNWLQLIIETAKETAPNANLTLGWSDVQHASRFSDKLDILSFHIYKNIETERQEIESLKAKNLGKPLYVSEFGKTSYQSTLLPFGSTAKEQAIYTKQILDCLNEEEIDHFAYWTLHDFTKAPKEVIGSKPWIRNAQKSMGLVKDGNKLKPASINFQTNEGYTEPLKWHEIIKNFHLLVFVVFVLLIGWIKIALEK